MFYFFRISLITLFICLLYLSMWAQNRVILKIKPEYKKYCKPNSIQIPSYADYFSSKNIKLHQLFPNAYIPPKNNHVLSNQIVDISTIYEFSCNSEQEAQTFIKNLSKLPETEYCHIKHYPELLYSPNDPAIGAQYYLNNIKAYQAWDIFKGDSTIIIGIVDTGIELVHDDLWENLAYNTNDPIDGIDNDGDGYVDNFHGWDLGNNDNSPEWSENTMGSDAHGVFVTGMAAPTTNNGIGIAGIAYKTKFLPVKVNDSTGILIKAYEGIVYAADHGCKVINCSWGSPIPDEFGRDIVRYATYNRNCLIVAAAGNKGNTTNDVYYPAAYDEVICVAATNQWDQKWLKSCYGPHVSVSAPGENVYSTYAHNAYTVGWGTSYASPLVAGVAALCWGYRGKNLLPLQIRAIIEQTSDNIDTISENIPFANQIGKGRVNAYRALTDTIYKSVRFIDYSFNTRNDTTYLTGSFINLFHPTQNLQVRLTTTNPNIHIIQNTIQIGVMDSLATFTNNSQPFILTYNANAPWDVETSLFLEYTDIGYNDKQYIKGTINRSYTDINNDHITLSVCSNGKIGYNNTYPLQGSGILYRSPKSLISEMGLFILNKNKASWCFTGKNDFKTIIKANKSENGLFIAAESLFNDSLNSFPIGLEIYHLAKLFKSPNNQDCIWLNYTLQNNNNQKLDSLYVGLFSDVDLLNPIRNSSRFDSILSLLYFFPSNINGLHTGILLPDSFPKNFYAIDNDGAHGSLMVNDGISLNDLILSTKQQRYEAGGSYGNDVSYLVSYGPININANDSVHLTFILPFGRNKYELLSNAVEAKQMFDSVVYIPSTSYTSTLLLYPNPTVDNLFINLNEVSYDQNTFLIIYNSLGQKIITQQVKQKLICLNVSKFKQGLYFIQIHNDKVILNGSFIKQ
ncbi:MAG: S8 family serine peptidase [Bacteroidales bacterium]